MRRRFLILAGLATVLGGCGGGNTSTPAPLPPPVTGPPSEPPPVSNLDARFLDFTADSGLIFATGYSEAYDKMPRHFAGGIAAGDVDNDGDIDLFMTPGDLFPNQLFLNDGSGRFTDGTPAGLGLPKGGTENYKLSGPLLADFDGDGNLDLFVGGMEGDPGLMFQGAGDGSFTDISSSSGISNMSALNTVSAAAGDYDGDGDLDLALAHWGTPTDALAPGDTQTLWRNDTQNGVISFTSVSVGAGISNQLKLSLNGVLGEDHDYTFAPSFTDIDQDGVMDIFMVGDFYGSQVFMGNGDGTFSDVTDDTQINEPNGMGSAVGDFDNDLDEDWFVSSIAPNRLYENMDGVMINNLDAGISEGSWGWAACFADFDFDEDLDIFHTNGWVEKRGLSPDELYTEDRSRLFINNGDKTFEDKAEDVGVADALQGRGVICADFNGDRQVDILLTLNNSDPGALFWLSDNPDANTLEVRLTGKDLNSQGLGSRIIVSKDGQTQMRTINLNSNFISHNPARAYFGFVDSNVADEIKVIWPDGLETILNNVEINQVLNLSHPDL